MSLVASVQEHGDHIYITTPVTLFEPEQAERETFAFATDLRSAAPNEHILWLRGQYVEADVPNRNADEWSDGELRIKALTPVLMPVTVMHDLRSAVGTIADARLLTPEAARVPRARIDTTLAVWAHRFPEVAAECRANAGQSTLMQSMECLAPYYNCTGCGELIKRERDWQAQWRRHLAGHTTALASDGRSPARRLRNVTFSGAGLIFGTRGARGAMPSAHLEADELAAMHREAHEGKSHKPLRRKNVMEIEDTKYEALVSAKSAGESKVGELTAQLQEAERKVETLEADKVKAEEERDKEKKRADAAEEASRVAAMKDDRLSKFGSGFVAKLDKLETTAKRVREQAGAFSDEEWEARLVELEETLGVKRDAKVDDKGNNGSNGNNEATAGLLFDRKAVQTSGVGGGEVTAGESTTTLTEPSVQGRQSVMGGLIRPRKPAAKS